MRAAPNSLLVEQELTASLSMTRLRSTTGKPNERKAIGSADPREQVVRIAPSIDPSTSRSMPSPLVRSGVKMMGRRSTR